MTFNFFRPGEKFLILEIAPAGTSGLFINIDDDRNVIFEKLEEKIDLKKLLKSPAVAVARWSMEGHYFFEAHRRIMAVADPSLATTIPVPLDLLRDENIAGGKITAVEFENMIARAMAAIFERCRSEAARRIDVPAIHAILVSSKAKHFKVDGRSVASPVGYSGKKITLLFELVFTKRELFEVLKPLFAAPEGFFFAEAPQVRLSSIARFHPLPLALIAADGEASSLFILANAPGGHAVLYREKFRWSFKPVFDAIQNNFHVSSAAARELYAAHCANAMSPSAAAALKKTIEPAFAAFFDEVKKAKIGGPVYVDAPYALPFALPFRGAGAAFHRPPVDAILSEFNFSAGAKEFADRPGAVFHYLIPFLEAYFDKSDAAINDRLWRRLHWLA